jgi:nucleoside-diphosphate-sugar epimerase
MADYLVTGGAGFIGSAIVEDLVKNNVKVRVLDNMSTGSRDNLVFDGTGDAVEQGRVELMEGDIRDMDTCLRACAGVKYVFHEAAISSVAVSMEDPVLANSVNAGGTLNMLEAAKRNKVWSFVFASSAAVYGDGKVPNQESQLPRPLSPYAASKLAGEHYCHVYAEVYKLNTVCLRYFNVFGPRQSPESGYAAVIPRFIGKALRGEPLEVYGDGEQSRDFVYVDNVVTANIRAAFFAELDKVKGEVFNVANGYSVSINELIRAIGYMCRKLGLGNAPEVYYLEPRPGEIRHSSADILKAERSLDYHPDARFYDGLLKVFDYLGKKSVTR